MEYSTYAFLDKIRIRPGMYVGGEDLDHLMTFLNGYGAAMEEVGIKDSSEPHFSGFHDWVAEKLGYFESTAGWANMILAVAMGLDPKDISWEDYDRKVTCQHHQKSLQLFYQLLDEYRNLKSK